jgi:hypothetical protein
MQVLQLKETSPKSAINKNNINKKIQQKVKMSPKFANFSSKNLIIHIKKVFICQNIINTIWHYLAQLFWGVGVWGQIFN